MTPASAMEHPGNQALEVVADDDLERATIALVGDLATYRPTAKVVILEGGGDSDFDVLVVSRLFPDFARRVNLIGGGDKKRVRDLYSVLSENADRLGMTGRFYSIVDRDSDPADGLPDASNSFSWDVYHIENYLLSSAHVRSALAIVNGDDIFSSDAEAHAALEASAEALKSRLLYARLRRYVADEFVHSISINADADAPDLVGALRPAIDETVTRLEAAKANLSEVLLRDMAKTLSGELDVQLADGQWMLAFPGRDILKQFINLNAKKNIKYEIFRNLVLDKMAGAQDRPNGMAAVIERIAD